MYKKTTFWGKWLMYTINMVLATAEKALKPKSKMAKRVAWGYAALLAIMAISQLFAFEDFVPLMRDMALPGGNGTASLVACLIVMAEVLSLPFLLRMDLSPLMRWFGLVCSVLLPIAWIGLSLWAFEVFTPLYASAAKGAIFGTKVSVPDAYQLVVAMVLLASAVYTTYGLWPAHKSAQKK